MNRHHGNTHHNLIVATQQGYTLNNVSAPVLYKLIHYFMENPINGETTLKYPIEEREVAVIIIFCTRDIFTIKYHSAPQSTDAAFAAAQSFSGHGHNCGPTFIGGGKPDQ